MYLADLAAEQVRLQLRAHGVGGELPRDPHAVFIRCAAFLERAIWSRSRPAFRSRVLRARSLEPDVEQAVNRIELASVAGLGLNKFQSTTLLDDKADLLLLDWGIHHLHLDLARGRPTRNPRFVRRADEILMVFVDVNRLLLLDVRRHHQWTDKALLEIVHADWPEVLASAKTDCETADEVDHEHARAAGASVLTVMSDGTVYTPVTGGYTMAGTSFDATRFGNEVMTLLWHAEQAHAEVMATPGLVIVRVRVVERGLSLGIYRSDDGSVLCGWDIGLPPYRRAQFQRDAPDDESVG